MDADECRAVVDLLSSRALRRDFESGDLPIDVQPEELKDFYSGTGDNARMLIDRLINDTEWTLACQRIADWQDATKDAEKPIFQRIFSRFNRFPSRDRVAQSLGEARAAAYRSALETIEDDPSLSSLFPSLDAQPWRKFDLDAAVSVVVDVLAAHISNEAAMTEAYETLVLELRARRRERAKVSEHSDDRKKRKILVRSFGIWFPLSKDIDIWRKDLRTAPRMQEFENLVEKVSGRMKLVRSYLQHVPRRRLSNRTVVDFDANIQRLRAYLRGEAVAAPPTKKQRV